MLFLMLLESGLQIGHHFHPRYENGSDFKIVPHNLTVLLLMSAVLYKQCLGLWIWCKIIDLHCDSCDLCSLSDPPCTILRTTEAKLAQLRLNDKCCNKDISGSPRHPSKAKVNISVYFLRMRICFFLTSG